MTDAIFGFSFLFLIATALYGGFMCVGKSTPSEVCLHIAAAALQVDVLLILRASCPDLSGYWFLVDWSPLPEMINALLCFLPSIVSVVRAAEKVIEHRKREADAAVTYGISAFRRTS